jgi:hypothetical protein
VRFNATPDFPSFYSSHPSPEIDAAWDKISINGTSFVFVPLYESVVLYIHKTPVRPTQMTLEEIRKAGEVDSLSKIKYPDKADTNNLTLTLTTVISAGILRKFLD